MGSGSDAPGAAAIRAELAAVAALDGPDHFHVEAISALRGLLRRGDTSPQCADRALDLLS